MGKLSNTFVEYNEESNELTDVISEMPITHNPLDDIQEVFDQFRLPKDEPMAGNWFTQQWRDWTSKSEEANEDELQAPVGPRF